MTQGRTNDIARRGTRVHTRAPILIVLLLTSLCACAAPVSVQRISPREAQADLTRTVLSSGKLSEKAKGLLRRSNNEARWQRDSAGVLESLHSSLAQPLDSFDSELRATVMDAVAELAFAHATKSGDRRYYLAAAMYAWVYLVPPGDDPGPSALSPGVRLSADIYNRSITLAFLDPQSGQVLLRDGEHELPFGVLDVDFDEGSSLVGNQEIGGFVSLADLRVRGLNNRYRISGLGAPLAAGLVRRSGAIEEDGAGRNGNSEKEEALDGLFFDEVRVPVSALLEFHKFDLNFGGTHFSAELSVIPFTKTESVQIQGQDVPLEFEPSATLALQLTEVPPWKRELNGFFQGDLALGRAGLISLTPFQAERIPLILVHGTASSAGRWADLINDLSSDATLRRYFQIWIFRYNTGNPIAYSAWLLREEIRKLVESLDPQEQLPTLRDLVVMGHSQGGLLTKLLAVDSGEVFWRQVVDKPPDAVELEPKSRELLEGSLIIEPSPYVDRLIFLSTPHRGSHLADLSLARLLGRFVRSPANLVNAAGDLFDDDAEEDAQRRIAKGGGAIGNMSPGSPFIQELAEMPIEPGIHAHSIIGVKGKPKEESGDGVVSYQSAHLEDVESERVVVVGHSSQANPEVVSEVRRILILHLRDAIARGIVPAP